MPTAMSISAFIYNSEKVLCIQSKIVFIDENIFVIRFAVILYKCTLNFI